MVDGIINSGNTDSTVIKLSRTVPLSGATSTIAETKAKVTVESNANSTTYALNETVKGTYISPGHLNLDKTAQYRLRIITSNGKTYLSDFVVVKEAPPIDTVTYTIPADGVQVYVSAHNPANNTRYYRYEYVETWIIHSGVFSSYIVVNNTIVPRTTAQQIWECWNSANSADIVLASSVNLTNDVVTRLPVGFVPASSQKLRIRYSMVVKQYALTTDAFSFWQLVQKKTQQLGSIFDAQPSQIKGNIHNINDSSEPVFGYVSAGTVSQKRIFVDRTQLPYTFGSTDPFAGCSSIPLPLVPPSQYSTFFGGALIPIEQIFDNKGNFLGYSGGERECTDCTILGGTAIRPAFWTDQ